MRNANFYLQIFVLISLSLPCLADYGNVLKFPCDGNFPSCAKVLPLIRDEGLKPVLEQAFSDAYEGKVYPNGRNDVSGAQYNPVGLGESAICARQALPLNGCVAEEKTNRKRQDCGDFARLHYVNPPVYAYSLPATRGSRESAWVAGVFLSAIQEAGLRLGTEIAENRLSLPTESACQSSAQDWFTRMERMKADPVMPAILGCKGDGLVACTTQDQLQATMNLMRGAYLQVARCLIFEEASRAVRDWGREAVKRVTNGAVIPCVRACGDDPACLPACYPARASKWFADELNSKFPLTSAACAGGM